MIGLGSDKNVKAPRATFCADPNPNSPGMIVLMMMVMVRLAWHDCADDDGDGETRLA